VKLDRFEGPLDLLLHLVRRHEMDIYDIPIAIITSQYLSFLDEVGGLDLDRAGDYLLMAATLMAIKARTLIPGHEDDEEEEDVDPNELLSLRLIEYQAFKEVSRRLSVAAGRRMKLYPRGDWLSLEDEAEDGEGDGGAVAAPDISINEMLKSFTKLIYTIKPVERHHVSLAAYTVEEKIVRLRERLAGEGTFEFLSLFCGMVEREELVVTFVALLELIHLGEARVKQRGNFKKLIVFRIDVDEG
jgi:segregation and condensation protein A